MSDFDLVIRGGTIGTASAVFDADIGIKGGVITAIGKALPAGQSEVDAKGKLVLPGGVDTHTHIEEPRGGGPTVNADTFVTAGASAAAGGTTTVIGFARQERGGSLTEAVAEHHERAKKSLIDYSFHMILTEPRLDILQQEIIQRLPAGPAQYPDDYLTDQPERFLAAEIIREKVLHHTQQEVPHAVAILIDTWQETPKLLKIAATIYVERAGQKAILIGAGGSALKKIGTLARYELERVFDRKVFLQTFVKVRAGWRQDPEFLAAVDWRAMSGN